MGSGQQPTSPLFSTEIEKQNKGVGHGREPTLLTICSTESTYWRSTSLLKASVALHTPWYQVREGCVMLHQPKSCV